MITTITVIDSIMGSGKTTWAINHMNKNPNKHFLYITPYKKEAERIQTNTNGFYVPSDDDEKPKLPRVKVQLKKKRSIASTHALFKLFDDECINLIMEGNYTLILDEVLEILNPVNIKKDDIGIIAASGAAIVDDTYRMIWTDKYVDLSENGYGWLKNLIKLNKVINVDNEALMWQFPPEIFDVFKNIYILTYLFESNIMSNYLKVNNLDYAKMSVRSGNITDYYKPDLTPYRELISIYEGKLNTNIYQTNTSLSLNWYNTKENKVYIDRMKSNLYNWFHHITQARSQDTMWTTFKDYAHHLKGKGYTKGFVSAGCRATNEFSDRSVLAYCINKFYQPMIKKYFSYMGCPVDEDLYALSDLIQWIWRSQIRESKPIDIYIPSQRMRQLLNNWLTNC